ncbi:MAG: hypothetical protein ACRC6F_10970 [Aeromonas sp.]
MKNSKLALLVSAVILCVGIATPASAAYYTDNNQYAHSEYLGKLNLWMSGNTRYGVSGTYIKSGRSVSYLDAILYDNGVRKGSPATDTWNTGVTTGTYSVSYSGISSKHYVEDGNATWIGYN